jgi:hypothetical protein
VEIGMERVGDGGHVRAEMQVGNMRDPPHAVSLTEAPAEGTSTCSAPGRMRKWSGVFNSRISPSAAAAMAGTVS